MFCFQCEQTAGCKGCTGKAGAIKHFFLAGGCDGTRAGRNYYTEFV